MCRNSHLHVKTDISHVFAQQEFKNCTDLIKRVQFESIMRLDIKGKKMAGRVLWSSSSPIPLFKAGSAGALYKKLHGVGFGIPPEIVTPQPL